MSIFSLALALLILAFSATMVRRIYGTWLAPGGIFPIIWLLFTFISALIAPEYPIFPLGLFVIVSFSLSVTLGSIIASPANGFNVVIDKGAGGQLAKINIRSNILWDSTAIFSILSGVGVVLVILFGMERYRLGVNLLSFAVLPNLFSIDRYDEVLVLPWSIKILMYLVYSAALLGGITLQFMTGWKKIICYLPLLIGVLYGTIFAVREGILLAIILFLSGSISTHVLKNRRLGHLVENRSGMVLAMSILVLLGLYVALQWLRAGIDEVFILDEILSVAKAAIFGSLSAFTIWLRNVYLADLSWGQDTFVAPLELIGLTVRKIGFYTESVSIGDADTNIYTVFRGLIQDFSFLGSILFGIGLGLVGSIAFQRTFYGRVLWILPLSLFYSFTLFSPLISLFTSNSVIAAWVITFFLLLFILRPLKYQQTLSAPT